MTGSRAGKPTTRTNAHYPTRAHPHGARFVQPALVRAQALVQIVRDEDANAVARILDPLTWEQIAAVVVVLATLTPDDVPVGKLTAWVHQPHPALRVVS